MSTQLPTQLRAHVDNAPSSLKAARYPQAHNSVDNCFNGAHNKSKYFPTYPSTLTRITYLSGNTVQMNRATSCVYGYIMFTMYLSFTTSTILPSLDWEGAAAYRRLFSLDNWSVSLGNLWIFAILYIAIAMVAGLFLAILIDQKVRLESGFRSIFLYPMALSFIVTGTAWKWLLDPGVGLEHTLQKMGWSDFSFGWIKDSEMAIYCVVIAAVWQTTGFVMAMFLAGLRGVDNEQVNAARLDGAKPWQIYYRVIIPQLGPVFISAFVILAHMAIKSYDLVIALTNGGPGRSTWLPSVFMYQYTFTRNEMSVGAASSALMLLGIGVVVIPYLYSELRKGKNG